MSSFSTSSNVAMGFATASALGTRGMLKGADPADARSSGVKVKHRNPSKFGGATIFELKPGARSLNMQGAAGKDYSWQRERTTSGRFRVESIKMETRTQTKETDPRTGRRTISAGKDIQTRVVELTPID